MTARIRRLASDWEQIQKEFAGHRYIAVIPIEGDPPERYRVTYFLNGIYLLPDGEVETLGRHEVEIALHAEYPRYKPVCRIFTPIWHPNFRDGQICIGDIWGAGESLVDIIINIGDMIQYKSWNSYSPLSADAAKWAIENRHLFPVGDIELHKADFTGSYQNVEIDLQDEQPESIDAAEPVSESSATAEAASISAESSVPQDESVSTGSIPETNISAESGIIGERENMSPFTEPAMTPESGNDFDISAEELSGIEFIPSAHRMQNAPSLMAGGKKVNFKTILVKGILWAIIGAVLGFGVSEALDNSTNSGNVLRWMGYNDLAEYSDLSQEIIQMESNFAQKYSYIDFDTDSIDNLSDSVRSAFLEDYKRIQNRKDDQTQMFIGLVDKYGDTAKYGSAMSTNNVDGLVESYTDVVSPIDKSASYISTGFWAALIAVFLGLFLGIGEGVYYGSGRNAVKYALIGAGISIVIGFASGYLAQMLYSSLIHDQTPGLISALIRGLGWGVMGIGVGLSAGLIKPGLRRILFCTLGGFIGAFIGGFIFNFISFTVSKTDTGIFSRGIGIVIMGLLIGLCIGLLEQFAKAAWLKVVRGEFEGKEYLVFTGTTSIGNNAKNTIVLFKDKLVGPHHCDIVLEGRKYVLIDQGTPMGTVVNGMRTERHVLKKGDTIAIGNSVLVFNTK